MQNQNYNETKKTRRPTQSRDNSLESFSTW